VCVCVCVVLEDPKHVHKSSIWGVSLPLVDQKNDIRGLDEEWGSGGPENSKKTT
jgi:hypothetical protein